MAARSRLGSRAMHSSLAWQLPAHFFSNLFLLGWPLLAPREGEEAVTA